MLEKASKYFDDADLNEDGELSPTELQAFVRQLAGLSANEVFTPEEQKKMFFDLDKDNDRALSRKGNICLFILHIRNPRDCRVKCRLSSYEEFLSKNILATDLLIQNGRYLAADLDIATSNADTLPL